MHYQGWRSKKMTDPTITESPILEELFDSFDFCECEQNIAEDAEILTRDKNKQVFLALSYYLE